MRRYLSIAASLLILAFIYWRIDVHQLLGTLARADVALLVAALAMVVPTTGLSAWRFKHMSPPAARIGMGSALRLTLAASAMNMVLPSKMGDIAKAHFVRRHGTIDGGLAFSVTIHEKALDLLALLAWCVFGLVIYQPKSVAIWGALVATLLGLTAGVSAIALRRPADFGLALVQRFLGERWQRAALQLQSGWSGARDQWLGSRGNAIRVISTSVLIWFLHLFQIWLFILALRASVPLLTSLGLTPLALMIGLLPFTFAGIGTRDAALILLYAPYFDSATGAALGLLCTLRYLLPGLFGLPFLSLFLGFQEAPARPPE